MSSTSRGMLDEMQRVGKKLLRQVIAERDCFYDGCSLADGSVPDPDDQRELKELDELIDEGRRVFGDQAA